MTRTFVILDGLTDPALARRLSRAWTGAGFDNAIDASGQRAWIAPTRTDAPLTEKECERAAQVARAVGLELRDRAGSTFRADNSPLLMGRQVVYEYRSRFATALVYGLPALALHYLSPLLAVGGGLTPNDLIYPWLFEALLSGWVILAAGWPMLWQGLVSLIHLRMTSDLFYSLIAAAAFVPSAVGVLALPFLDAALLTTVKAGGVGPMFHVAVIVTILASLQRWLAHAAAWGDLWGQQAPPESPAENPVDGYGRPLPPPKPVAPAPVIDPADAFKLGIGGRADLMLLGLNAMLWFWALLALAAGVLATLDAGNTQGPGRGWKWGLALALLMPHMVGLAGINPRTPRWSAVVPVFAFAGFLAFGSKLTGRSAEPVLIESAAGFALVMSLVMAAGWRAAKR